MRLLNKSSGKQKQFLAFYEFKDQVDPEELRQNLLKQEFQKKLLGTLILAEEGINGSVIGTISDNQFLLDTLKNLNFNDLTINRYLTNSEAYDRFRIKIKKEIVTSEFNVARINKSSYIDPEKWDEEIKRHNMTIIDVRNFYESNIGSFQNSIKPMTHNFKEFKKVITSQLAQHPREKPIGIFCTGGIRCEKAADFLNSQGFSSVHKLNGGILNYFKNNPQKKSLWSGDCFVFDKRVAINKHFECTNYQQCYGCKQIIRSNERFESLDEWTLCTECKKLRNHNDKN